MTIMKDPFKFVDVIEKEGALLISYTLAGTNCLTTIHTVRHEIEQLRAHGVKDYEMPERIKAVTEYERAVERNNWPDFIDG